MLDLDVDNLFEKHSVSEIETVNQQIRNEIEKKKEELRSMVGYAVLLSRLLCPQSTSLIALYHSRERYRDLLKAADTINDMKKTSSDVILNIEHVLQKCRSVHEHQLIGFNAEQSSNHQSASQRPRAELYSTLQIKILCQLPELIWSHLDNDEFFIATQLFIFARHINTGLRLNKSTTTGGLLMNRFPLVKNQWAILQQFFGIIKERCNSRLETEDLHPDVAAKCLASLILLDSPGIESLLQNLMNHRLKAFCDVLNDNSPKFSVVRDKLLASLNVLNNTVLLVHQCFIDQPQKSQKSLLTQQLSSLSSDTSPYTISHLSQSVTAKSLQFLPDIISKYRPNVSVTEVPLQSVHQMMQKWLNRLLEISSTNVKTLVHLIGSVKVIREIKQSSFDRDRIPNWDQVCTDLNLPQGMNFYRNYYHALINDRVKEIIQSSWSETEKQLRQDIHKLLLLDSNAHQNMAKFMWTEEQSDIPLSLGMALDADHKKRKLLMKSRGFVPEVLEICTSFDRNLEVLYKDVDNYLARSPANAELRQDQEDLVQFLVESSKAAVQQIIRVLRTEEKIQDKESFLQMARLYTAIRDLCPHLRLIVCFRMDGVSLAAGEENWLWMHRLLHEESIAYWTRFADQYFAEWCVSDALARPLADFGTILEEFAAWKSVTIEEKDEQDNALQSTIRIPAQPSIRLQTTLFRIATELNKIAPHTVPSSVVGHLMERVAGELLKNYEKFNENPFVRENQNVSLQFYFDVKYLSLLLIHRDMQDKAVAEVSQRLANVFKGQVDPFDFELFFVHLTKNVKTAAHRTQHQLGVIIPNMEHLVAVLGSEKQTTTTTTDREPNVLALSGSGVTWFPLLPIANSQPVAKETAVGVVTKKEEEVS